MTKPLDPNVSDTPLRADLLRRYHKMLRVCATIDRMKNNGVRVPKKVQREAHNDLAQIEALLRLPAPVAIQAQMDSELVETSSDFSEDLLDMADRIG